MSKDSNTGLILLEAAIAGNIEKAKQLLQENNTIPIVTDDQGRTALHWAVINNNPTLVNWLLIYHFAKNTFDDEYRTPAVLAATLKLWDVVSVFIKHDNQNDTRGLDAVLLYATKQKQFLIVKKILECGTPPNSAWTDTQFTPLHWAIENRDPTMIALLLSYNADQSIKDNSNRTPLLRACQQNYWKCVISLCQRPVLPVKEYNRALILAAKANHYHAVKALLMAGADPNAIKSREGNYALHWAVINDSPEMFALFIGHKASVKVYDQSNLTPIHLIFKHDRVKLGPWVKALQLSENEPDNSADREPAIQAGLNKWQVPGVVNALYAEEQRPSKAMIAVAQNNLTTLKGIISEPELDKPITPEGLNILEYAIQLEQTDVLAYFAHKFPKHPSVLASFNQCVEQQIWPCAQAINQAQAIAAQLDQALYKQIAWYKTDITEYKQALMNKTDQFAEKYDCDKQALFMALSKTKTATYRRFMFWKTEPTKTTEHFINRAKCFGDLEAASCNSQKVTITAEEQLVASL